MLMQEQCIRIKSEPVNATDKDAGSLQKNPVFPVGIPQSSTILHVEVPIVAKSHEVLT
jgi:hypothetical protein